MIGEQPPRLPTGSPALTARIRQYRTPSSGIILAMNNARQSLDTRLAVLAAELVLPGLPVVPDRVIPLALDLLAADRGTPGTVEVGALAPGSTMRDAETSIRQMLAEQGIDLPESVDTEEGQYAVALWALGNGGLSVGEFSVSFYPRLPAVGQQNETDQELVLLLDNWERESDPALRRRVEAKIREVAARA
jgi:hypothetical protein